MDKIPHLCLKCAWVLLANISLCAVLSSFLSQGLLSSLVDVKAQEICV